MYKITPSADLRNKYSKISELVKEDHRPLVITKNGEGDLVVMSIELFEEMEMELEIYKRLAENKIDIANGHFLTGQEASQKLKSFIKNEHKELIADLKTKYIKAEEP